MRLPLGWGQEGQGRGTWDRAPVADVFQGREDNWGEPQKSGCPPDLLRAPSFSGKGHGAGRG